MIKAGDYLICKKTLYLDDNTLLNKIKNRIFQTHVFKKNLKYKIERIEQRMTNSNEYYQTYFINIKFKTLNFEYDFEFPKQVIDKYFYTEQEIRKEKLKKLKR